MGGRPLTQGWRLLYFSLIKSVCLRVISQAQSNGVGDAAWKVVDSDAKAGRSQGWRQHAQENVILQRKEVFRFRGSQRY